MNDLRPLELDAVVVGASWAGIWALYRMASLGLRVRMIEACPDVGGVWYYTRYPGCRVDTPVPLYEFSMEQLWKEWNWKSRFPSRAEIHDYLVWVCDRLDIRKREHRISVTSLSTAYATRTPSSTPNPVQGNVAKVADGVDSDIIFNTRVTGAHWREGQQKWKILVDGGKVIATTRFLLPCSGYSTIKYMPPFKGAHTFKNAFHSSAWPESLDYTNKRVAVIGTAASGIQIIETIAPKVAHLIVFQRTPNLATPMQQKTYDVDEMEEYKRDYPNKFAARLSRNGFDTPGPSHNTFDDSIQQRQAFWGKLWTQGSLNFWFANYPDMIVDSKANDAAYEFWRQKTIKRIDDPIKQEILAPKKKPHAFGAKRPSLETRYYERFNQPNVGLVDVNSEPILEITPTSIITSKGRYDVDIIAFATGFDFITGSMLAMGIKGEGGVPLSDRWDVRAGTGTGVWTHLGIMTAGFPNMFFPMGPQAPSALGLTPHMAEVQGDWVADLVAVMARGGKTSVQPTREAEARWKQEVNRAAESCLLGTADSWYMGVNIPGRRKEALCYFGGVEKYIAALAASAAGGYADFVFDAGDASSADTASSGCASDPKRRLAGLAAEKGGRGVEAGAAPEGAADGLLAVLERCWQRTLAAVEEVISCVR